MTSPTPDVAATVAELRSEASLPMCDADIWPSCTLNEAADIIESQINDIAVKEAAIVECARTIHKLMTRALAAEARLADKEAELSIARQINHDLTDGITGTLQKDKIERLEARLAEAIKHIESADLWTDENYDVGDWREGARTFTNAAKEKT